MVYHINGIWYQNVPYNFVFQIRKHIKHDQLLFHSQTNSPLFEDWVSSQARLSGNCRGRGSRCVHAEDACRGKTTSTVESGGEGKAMDFKPQETTLESLSSESPENMGKNKVNHQTKYLQQLEQRNYVI